MILDYKHGKVGIIGTKQEQRSGAIKIRSIQAASLYRYNNHYKFRMQLKTKDENGKDTVTIEYRDSYFDFGNAVINNSLFLKYVRKHGVTVDKKNMSLDFLMLKFDWGIDEDNSNEDEKKVAMNSRELRDYYYQNGAKVTWEVFNQKTGEKIKGKEKTITYKMLMRSPGKAKEGHCIFVREELQNTVLKYITMGLLEKMSNVKGAKIVEMSAYSPLITATAIDYIHIPMENIFVLKDEEVSIFKKAVTVKNKNVEYAKERPDYPAFEQYINQIGLTFYKKKLRKYPHLTWIDQNKKELEKYGISATMYPSKKTKYFQKNCYVVRDNESVEITNVLWDGMGLIDESIFPAKMEGFIYCRSHFFKSCLFRGHMQDYFKSFYGNDYSTAYEMDMFGRKMKVTDIKIIVTENSLKWMKFLELMSKSGTKEDAFRYYEKIMKKDGEEFAIVKTGHSSKYGEIQRSSFQMNNTLLTTDYNILKKIAAVSIEYCNKLKVDDEAFLEYLANTGSARYSINNVLIDLYRLNDEFRYLEYFKIKKTSKINELKNQRLRLGKLFQYGDNLTICGNPIAMLMKVTGQDFLNEGCFKQMNDRIECCTYRFPEGEMIAGFRSPHNSPNNIVYLENVYPDSVKTYFPKLGQNVIIINGIRTDVQSRLNGQDLDTDSIYATNQEEIVELAKEAYLNYSTIINGIKPEGSGEYDKDMLSYSKMDYQIASAQYAIGSASNIAQLALSYYSDEGCNNQELEDVFIICSVLAQVAIDSAKRTFDVNVGSELDRITRLPCMKRTPRYPVFYAEVQKYNNKKKRGKKFKIEDSDVGRFNCPMDILFEIIDKEVIDLREHKKMNTRTNRNVKSIFEYKADMINVDRKQYRKVIGIVREYDKKVGLINMGNETYYKDRLAEFDICMEKLKNLTIKENTIYTLIAYAFKAGNEDIRDSLLTVLYDKDRRLFLGCFKKTDKSPQESLKNVDL